MTKYSDEDMIEMPTYSVFESAHIIGRSPREVGKMIDDDQFGDCGRWGNHKVSHDEIRWHCQDKENTDGMIFLDYLVASIGWATPWHRARTAALNPSVGMQVMTDEQDQLLLSAPFSRLLMGWKNRTTMMTYIQDNRIANVMVGDKKWVFAFDLSSWAENTENKLAVKKIDLLERTL